MDVCYYKVLKPKITTASLYYLVPVRCRVAVVSWLSLSSVGTVSSCLRVSLNIFTRTLNIFSLLAPSVMWTLFSLCILIGSPQSSGQFGLTLNRTAQCQCVCCTYSVLRISPILMTPIHTSRLTSASAPCELGPKEAWRH